MISSPTPEGCFMGVRPYPRDAAADPLSASTNAAWAAFACPGLVARVTRVEEKERQQPVSAFSLILMGVARVARVARVIPAPPVFGPRRQKRFEYLCLPRHPRQCPKIEAFSKSPPVSRPRIGTGWAALAAVAGTGCGMTAPRLGMSVDEFPTERAAIAAAYAPLMKERRP